MGLMKEVFRDRDYTLVGLCKSALIEAGIPIVMRNENLSSLEVPIPAFHPAVCVADNKDYERAREIVLSLVAPAKVNTPDWQCESCEEETPGNFELCYSCQSTRPTK